MKKLCSIVTAALVLTACQQPPSYDASGHFEADEVIVSARQTGILSTYLVKEGASLKAGQLVGQIDVQTTALQKQQVEASMAALSRKTVNPKDQAELVRRQLIVQESQLAQQQRERQRIQNLVTADAATRKQLDDMDALVDQLQKQIEVTRQQLKLSSYTINTQNESILSERAPLKISAAQLQEQINQAQVVNPINGTVLVSYALPGELQTIGKPLYKIANTDTLELRAYISGAQLAQIKLGQQVTVRTDYGGKAYKSYPGMISWISEQAEFTPKTIQTREERASLVYAIKVRVKNDGYLKIGMYGETTWSNKQ